MTTQTFTIVVGDSRCRAHCPFCISKLTPDPTHKFKSFDVSNINSRSAYDWALEEAIRIAKKAGVRNVLLTGKGEPTLHPYEITYILHKLAPHGFKSVELQTNGQRVDFSPGFWLLCSRMGLNLLAISMYHWEDTRNNQIFYPSPFQHENSGMNLALAIKKARDAQLQVRLSCVLIKGLVDNVPKVQSLLHFAYRNDVAQITLRGVGMPRSLHPSKKKKIKPYMVPQKNIERIWNYLEGHGELINYLPFGGAIFRHNHGMSICMTSCLTHEPDLSKLRHLIYYPSIGFMTTSWEDPYYYPLRVKDTPEYPDDLKRFENELEST